MGLLSKLTSAVQPKMKAEDHTLLLHALTMMAGADAILEQSELDTLTAFWTTLPEFRGKNYSEEMRKVEKMAAQYDSQQEAIQALGEIESEKIRKKCYVLCADMAMASGDVDEAEDALLESMQRVLGVDDPTAKQALEVLAMKYAS